MEGLIAVAAMVLLAPAVQAGLRRRAGRRRAAEARGERVTLRAALRGSAGPLPTRWTAGRLHLFDDTAVWVPQWRRVPALDLWGARSLGMDATVRSRHQRPSAGVLLIALPDGTRLHLITTVDDVALIEKVLDDLRTGPAPGPPRPVERSDRLPWWAATLLTLSVLEIAFASWVWFGGTWVEATTTATADGDGYCDIRWTNPHTGGQETSETVCDDDDPVGTIIRVLSAPPPLDGTAGNTEDSILVAAVFAGPIILPTVIYFGRRWARPSPGVPVRVEGSIGAALLERVESQELGEGEVAYPRLLEVLTARGVQRGHPPRAGGAAAAEPERPAPAWWREGVLRRIAGATAAPGLFPLLVCAWLVGLSDGARWAWIAVVLAVVFALYRVSVALQAVSELRRLRQEPGRPWRYIVFTDPGGAPGVMLFSQFDDGPPEVLVPLAPLPGGPESLPVAGLAQVHGKVADAELVVPVVDGVTLWPLMRAEAVAPEVVRKLINGRFPCGPAAE